MLPSLSESADLEALADAFDGFLFPGGQDVAPELYGAEVLPHCGPRCPERDEMEAAFLPLVRRRGKAVLGICRGLQFFNVALGGTLYQDLPTEHPSNLLHSQARPYDAPQPRGYSYCRGRPSSSWPGGTAPRSTAATTRESKPWPRLSAHGGGE